MPLSATYIPEKNKGSAEAERSAKRKCHASGRHNVLLTVQAGKRQVSGRRAGDGVRANVARGGESKCSALNDGESERGRERTAKAMSSKDELG